MTPWGIHFTFPLRDLFKAELELYSALVSSNLQDIIVSDSPSRANLSNRNMSIDELISQYVETQGEKYPGVMANIVRTIDKLQVPFSDGGVKCVVCGLPVNYHGQGLSDSEVRKGYQYTLTEVEKCSRPRPTCYGCSRSFLDIEKPNLTAGDQTWRSKPLQDRNIQSLS
jgi:cytoplasmic tRNA 2-thiolation protein 2